MYFSIFSSFLLRKLHALYKIIDIHGLSNLIIFEIDKKNQLQITWGLDSKNLIQTYMKINVKKYTKEKITISIKFIIDVLTTFSNENLFIKKEKNTLNIYSQYGIYEIPICFDSNQNYKSFIQICKGHFIKIDLSSDILLKILNKTLFMSVREKLKPVLNGVLFQFLSHEANFISTDTYRLVKYTIKNFQINKNVQFIISRKYLNIIKEILKEEKEKSHIVIEYYDQKNIIFRLKNHILLCQLINEKYPNYHYIIPHKKCKISIIINKLLLLNTIKRIFLFSEKKNNFIDFHFNNNKLKICNQKTINIPTSEIQCKIVINNIKRMKIGFDSQFLIEILSSLEDFIYFEFYDKMGILKSLKKEESIFILIMSTIKI
ncbi:DNA polymerase III subunit beta [Blattabacterium cuenoti]|uniref:DNA polymerase III subunit beta n=1 Tax=Blattabacterium cuenoti TaxID=1653831 RepID=UPI00163C7532|nr:DNA polymerase III subunit beta [Blattabacterium cuenoti]